MRYKITFSYDGSNYLGYQEQPKLRTIQEQLNKALYEINNKQKTTVTSSGRTDKGVHALGQTAHIDLNINITPYKLKRAMNTLLPSDIHIIKTEEVNNEFHARYDTKYKTYKYLINTGEYNPINKNYQYQHNHKLNIKDMKKAIKYLKGTHDYRAFVTENVDKDNCVRTITKAKINKINKEEYEIVFTGTGFMKYQVRNMVGILLKVGTNKIKYNQVKEILESKTRGKYGSCAPAEGLYLVEVGY